MGTKEKEEETRKIYVIGSGKNYANWMQGDLVEEMEDADLVVLTGGEDINPALYDDNVGQYTIYNDNRDKYELGEIKKAVSLKKPIIGICRGLQLMAAINGAKLIQHMQHPHKHLIKFYDGSKEYTNSLHHQMVKPFNLPADKYFVIAYAESLSKIYLNGNNNDTIMKRDSSAQDIECEIVYFPEYNMLGIQGHPEMLSPSSGFVQICRILLDLQLNNDLKTVLQLKIPITRLIEGSLGLTEEEKEIINTYNESKIAKSSESCENKNLDNQETIDDTEEYIQQFD